jgi:hypothetical protein
MKQKSCVKKLVIKKVTITSLSNDEQVNVHGGGTVWGRTCEFMPRTFLGHQCQLPLPLGTVWGRTCVDES